jgi:hypothetical protein
VARGGLAECTFLVPVLRNSDRQPHEPIAWREFQDQLRKLSRDFSGPQKHPIIPFMEVELIPGEWERVGDESRKYSIAVPEDKFDVVRAFLREQLDRFDQSCIYLSIATSVEFITRDGAQTSAQIGAQNNEAVSTDYRETH